MQSYLLNLIERGWFPDCVVRWGIRRLLRERLEKESCGNCELRSLVDHTLWEDLRNSPLALETAAANQQHYEVPAEFFLRILGKRLKYSACYFPTKTTTLDEAETVMLEMSCERAGISDGMTILELGCGWGSLSLWLASKYPNSQIHAISNSHSQREYIESRVQELGLKNLIIKTVDINQFDPQSEFQTAAYDRIVSVEMFEHLRNYQRLFELISTWLKPDGKLFVHIFCHRLYTYPFETEGESNWMGRYFFTGGLMPSENLFMHFQDHLRIARHWRVNGVHYQRTLDAWLMKMDRQKELIIPILERVYGENQKILWWNRWRIFLMACSELFGFRKGNEWYVSHYLMEKRKA